MFRSASLTDLVIAPNVSKTRLYKLHLVGTETAMLHLSQRSKEKLILYWFRVFLSERPSSALLMLLLRIRKSVASNPPRKLISDWK